MEASELETKRQEYAAFRRWAVPVFVLFTVFALANALGSLVGLSFVPAGIRGLFQPAFIVGSLIVVPVMLKQARMQKAIKELEGGAANAGKAGGAAKAGKAGKAGKR